MWLKFMLKKYNIWILFNSRVNWLLSIHIAKVAILKVLEGDCMVMECVISLLYYINNYIFQFT